MINTIKALIKKILLPKKSYFEGNQKIHSTAEFESSSIIGEINIEEWSSFSNCILRGKISIGRYTFINGPTSLLSEFNPITIGNFCSIAQNVLIQEYNHYSTKISTSFINKKIFKESFKNDIFSKGGVSVGSDVWIGAGSIILSGVQIGSGAIIAANSTVTKDVPPYAIVGGNPAKIIKFRFEEEIVSSLLDLEWWNWPIHRIKENKMFFNESNVTIEMISKLK